MEFDYKDLFGRNYGILNEKEQQRISETKIVIIGDTGTGEVLATLLARCGFTRFTIAGNGIYRPSDMNRQIGCFSDTVGKNKVDIIAKLLLSINPAIRITTLHHLPSEAEMDQLIAMNDIAVPAVDDLSYSLLLFRVARKHCIPAILCVPAGTMGWVSVFTKDSPTPEDVFGIPKLDYPSLVNVMRTREFRCAQYPYVTSGNWRVQWFFDYFTGKRPLALLCPVEWLAASLAALETVKTATGRWSPMTAPRCWYLSKGNVRASRFSTFVRLHRKLGWALFGSDNGTRMHRLTHFIWNKFFKYLRRQEKNRSRVPQ